MSALIVLDGQEINLECPFLAGECIERDVCSHVSDSEGLRATKVAWISGLWGFAHTQC